jgi:hypothetical protein
MTASQTVAMPKYPDLKTRLPQDLRLDEVTIDGVPHQVLRFTNTVVNVGEGPLEVWGIVPDVTPYDGLKTTAWQRIYADAGSYSWSSDPYEDVNVGQFSYHAAHGHWHFERFARFTLYTAADYSGTRSQPRGLGTKNTFCIGDSASYNYIYGLPGSPSTAQYTTAYCNPARGARMVQGLSIGWGDTYGYTTWEQWVDLGTVALPNGQYVLQSVADPDNKLYESANKADPSRETTQQDVTPNEAITRFSVRGKRIKIQN